MVYDDIELKSGDTLSQIANDYGYNLWDWKDVWDHYGNSELKRKRTKLENLRSGDRIVIPLPWQITSKNMSLYSHNRYGINVKRDGVKGKNLRWVQTVFGDNQSLHPTPFGVDYLDDDDPFYYTESEVISDSNRRKEFFDSPWRDPHAVRTTTWRAVLSIASVSNFRVSIFQSIVWGVDFGKNGTNTVYTPREATAYEVSGHLRLLTIGEGITTSFKSGGWTFREALKNY